MDHFAGLDVSVKETSVCILDDAGKIVKEVKVASEPQALLKVLGNPTYHFKRIGLEAGPLSLRMLLTHRASSRLGGAIYCKPMASNMPMASNIKLADSIVLRHSILCSVPPLCRKVCSVG